MEIGVYLTNDVKLIFDKMEKFSGPSAKKCRRIILALNERFSNAPKYMEKITLSQINMTTENLTKILGEFFFGGKKDTKDNFDEFVKLFNSAVTPKQSTKPKQEPKPDTKSTVLELSEDFWSILEKLERENDPVCWALIKFVEHDQKVPGKNILSIKLLDIDKDSPGLVKAVFAEGKKTKMPLFNFLKQYFGTKFSNLELNEFADLFKKIVAVLSFEPGEFIEVEPFKFNPKNVRSTFLSLVTETYPHRHEEEVVKFLYQDLIKDEFGNYYKILGKSDTMFTAHLDTVSSSGKTKINLVSRMKEDQEIISSDGTTILGADDKAGVTILLYMIAHNIPGVYYFFIGEESGGIGSGKVADKFRSTPHLKNIRKCVSFDRRNYYSVITSQMYEPCCSDQFAEALCAELNKSGLKMGLDPTGMFTDSANFIEHIPECTNVSVGYFNEHSNKEALNITFLGRLAEACLKVNWSSLPVERQTEMSEDMFQSWDDVLTILQETGFYNEIKLTGNKKKLTIKLNLEQTDLKEAYTDINNLNYIFEQMKLTAKVTFDDSIIKFEIE